MSDGFIKISAVNQGDKIILTVKDNGKGFNPSETRENSQGLKNVTARFAYYLSATTFISSKPDEGTEIQIIVSNILWTISSGVNISHLAVGFISFLFIFSLYDEVFQ